MNYFKKNMGVLASRDPSLNVKLSVGPDELLEILPSIAGCPTARYRDIFIHSRYNPEREADQLVARETHEGASSAVFFGFGLGYLPEAFMKRFPSVPVLVIEPDPKFLIRAFEARDMSRMLGSNTLTIFCDTEPENIIAHLERMPLAKIEVIKLRSVYAKDEEYYRRVDGVITSYLAKKEINVNTLRRFGKLWVRNLGHNLRQLVRAPGIATIANAFHGLPGLVLASGPSLDRILPLLPTFRERLVIISVDTSLNACLRAGIEPDFLVVVDPQYWNTRHLDRARPQNSILISESSTHPRVFRMLELPVYFSSSFFPLGQFFESIAGEKGKVGAGGSVATAAWDIARILGLDPIHIAGLDLGYPEMKTHFRGAFFEQTFFTVSDKTHTAEKSELAYLLDADPFRVPSNAGGTTLTDKRMSIYKWWFESQMNLFPETRSINLSADGVRVNGMMHADASTLENFPVVRPEIDDRLEKIARNARSWNEQNTSDTMERMMRAVDALANDLVQLEAVANEGIREARKAKAGIRSGKIPEDALRRLDAIDERIRSGSSRIIAGFVLQPIIQQIFHDQPAHTDAADVIARTETLYRELAESAAFHRDVLSRASRSL